jgi:hypothetical protein
MGIQKFTLDRKSGFIRNSITNRVATIGKETAKRTWAATIYPKVSPSINEQHWVVIGCE